MMNVFIKLAQNKIMGFRKVLVLIYFATVVFLAYYSTFWISLSSFASAQGYGGEGCCQWVGYCYTTTEEECEGDWYGPDYECTSEGCCLSSNVCGDKCMSSDEVCCNGEVYKGDCCSDDDCPEGYECKNHVCTREGCCQWGGTCYITIQEHCEAISGYWYGPDYECTSEGCCLSSNVCGDKCMSSDEVCCNGEVYKGDCCSDDDCPSSRPYCLDHQCVECLDDSDCENGFCVDGTCVERPPPCSELGCDFIFEQALGKPRASEECSSKCEDSGYSDYSLQTCMYGGVPVYCCKCELPSCEGLDCDMHIDKSVGNEQALETCKSHCEDYGSSLYSLQTCMYYGSQVYCCDCYCNSDSDCLEGYVCQNSECTPEQNCEDMDCDSIMGGGTRKGWEWSCKFYCTQNNISKKYSLTPCQLTYEGISPSYCCNCICESDSDCYSNAPYCINNECQACESERFCEDRGYDCCLARLGADTYGGGCVNRGYITSDGKWLCVP